MILAMKRMLLAVFVVYLYSLIGIAAAQSEGNVIVNSDPQGSLVKLRGELTLSGVTPVKFDRVLSGRYEIEIDRDGYERFRTTTYFTELQPLQIDIELVRKTRTKAFFRSLIIPGWGQRYYGNSTKSTLFALSTVASTIGYVFVKDDYDSKLDTYYELQADRDAATKWSDIPDLEARLRDAQKTANDAETDLNIIKAVLVGVYAWNVLDAFLFFPEHSSYTEYKAITARPLLQDDRVGLNLSMRF